MVTVYEQHLHTPAQSPSESTPVKLRAPRALPEPSPSSLSVQTNEDPERLVEPQRILALVPSSDLRSGLTSAFNSAEFVLDAVDSGKEFLRFCRSEQYKAVVLSSDLLVFEDLVLVVKLVRQEKPHAAVYVLAQYLDLEQRLRLFEAGVDDSVCEPFYAAELVLRIRHSIKLRDAAARNAAADTVCMLRFADLELDLVRQRAARLGKELDLRPKEFMLLAYLMRNGNRPVTRTMILEQVWNSSFEGLTNVVDVYISSLRRKVDRGFSNKLIQTARGIGYCLASVENPPHTSE